MPGTAPTLHLICGKIASGKSTLAAKLADAPATVLISQDAWLSGLFGPEMKTGADYIAYAARLDAVLGDHVARLLQAGVSVVLDFPANTRAQRDHMRQIIDASGAAHQMHVLDVPDELCLARLANRNASGQHEFTISPAQFARFSAHFTTPDAAENFVIVRHHPR